MSHSHYIAIDLGAESGRVMLGTLSDDGISLSEVHRFPNLPVQVPHARGATLHWDILRLWHEIKTGLAKVAAQNLPITGIAVDVWGVDFALLDEHAQLIANPVCYRDPRTDGMVDAVFARLPREKIYAITGIQTMPINTLFQLAALSFKQPDLLARTRHILFLPDLLSYWLSGTMATEYSIASTSQMLDARGRAFSAEILHAIGIEPGLFPDIQMPGLPTSTRGTLLPGANETLAAQGVRVIAVGSHDTASAVAAVPADPAAGDWLYLSSGTWSLLGAEVAQPVLSPHAMLCNMTNEGGVGGKIRLLKNIAGLFLLQECRRDWTRRGTADYDYASLTDLAADATPHLALLDLSDPAFASPGNMPRKIAEHCRRSGQNVPATPGEFARVILESLAHSYAQVAGMLQQLTGKTFSTLHIVGGGSQNHLLNQMAADATGMQVLAGPVEATALGNILTQAITTGAIKSIPEARALIKRSQQIKSFSPRK
jgi:rhamnulokinase